MLRPKHCDCSKLSRNRLEATDLSKVLIILLQMMNNCRVHSQCSQQKIPKQISLGGRRGWKKTFHDKQTVSSIHDFVPAKIFNGNVLIQAFDIEVEK